MKNITVEISKDRVMDEVGETTGYTAKKIDEGTENEGMAFDRVRVTEEDLGKLERYWQEACAGLTEGLKKYVLDSEVSAVSLRLELGLSSAFDEALRGAMETEMYSYLVMQVTAKWWRVAHKSEAEEYARAASGLLEGVRRKACYKRKPERPKYK